MSAATVQQPTLPIYMQQPSLPKLVPIDIKNNYVGPILLTVVVYDYVLTFSSEVDYIWTKPWTWVSALFVLVRYAGLCSLALTAYDSNFPLYTMDNMYTSVNWCREVLQIISWALFLFFGAADLMMILRVWAMYGRSRLILITLLALFSVEIVFAVIVDALGGTPSQKVGATVPLLEFGNCAPQQSGLLGRTGVFSILQIIQSGMLCVLAIVQSTRQSLGMYRVNERWHLNQYMNLLINQGIIYFIAISLFSFINLFAVQGMFLEVTRWQLAILLILESVPMYTLTPRFILSIREMYAHDVHSGYGTGIDTGFGLSSGRGAVGTIVFADVEPNDGSGNVEEIRTDAMMTQAE